MKKIKVLEEYGVYKKFKRSEDKGILNNFAQAIANKTGISKAQLKQQLFATYESKTFSESVINSYFSNSKNGRPINRGFLDLLCKDYPELKEAISKTETDYIFKFKEIFEEERDEEQEEYYEFCSADKELQQIKSGLKQKLEVSESNQSILLYRNLDYCLETIRDIHALSFVFYYKHLKEDCKEEVYKFISDFNNVLHYSPEANQAEVAENKQVDVSWKDFEKALESKSPYLLEELLEIMDFLLDLNEDDWKLARSILKIYKHDKKDEVKDMLHILISSYIATTKRLEHSIGKKYDIKIESC